VTAERHRWQPVVFDDGEDTGYDQCSRCGATRSYERTPRGRVRVYGEHGPILEASARRRPSCSARRAIPLTQYREDGTVIEVITVGEYYDRLSAVG
jgi:hypothetical protein